MTQNGMAGARAEGADYASEQDRERAGRYARREADWRVGAVIYQVIVDRFAPAADLEEKRALYPAPKRLRAWDETPTRGDYVPELGLYSHEIDFWGGDLASLRAHLDHVSSLGADVLYLCPIVESYTNHGYDGLDYLAVAPWLGTRDDVTALAGDLHARGQRLVLDGVFNHVGRNGPLFQGALADPASAHRDWFAWDSALPGGARAWAGAQNLPELVLENPEVRAYLWNAPDSVVRSYLRDGVDGWRLDVAYELGFRYLSELTAAAHAERPGSLTVGEIASYPSEWFPALDGVLHWSLRRVLVDLARGDISAPHAQRILARTYADADYEHLLTSWLFLDNHDTERLPDAVPEAAARRLALALLHTLPGCPTIYYGSELGMSGGEDPAMRAPMRWDLVPGNDWLALTRHLVALRRSHRALRVGDLRWVETERLLAFERSTDKAADAVIVVANPSPEPVVERLLLPDSKIQAGIPLLDLLGGERQIVAIMGVIEVSLAPHECLVLSPVTDPIGGYTPYKRLQ